MTEPNDALAQRCLAQYEAHQAVLRRYQRTERMLGAALVLVILTFVVASYRAARANYAPEKLAPEFARGMTDIGPL